MGKTKFGHTKEDIVPGSKAAETPKKQNELYQERAAEQMKNALNLLMQQRTARWNVNPLKKNKESEL